MIDDGGFHRIVGRQSVDIIKTGGFKVGAGEVEAALLTHPGVVEAAVVGVTDPDLGQRIVAFVVCSEVDDIALDQPCRRAPVRAQAPREVRIVDVLPRNAMGKVQKTLLTVITQVACQAKWVTRSPTPSMVLVSTSPGLRNRGGLRA